MGLRVGDGWRHVPVSWPPSHPYIRLFGVLEGRFKPSVIRAVGERAINVSKVVHSIDPLSGVLVLLILLTK